VIQPLNHGFCCNENYIPPDSDGDGLGATPRSYPAALLGFSYWHSHQPTTFAFTRRALYMATRPWKWCANGKPGRHETVRRRHHERARIHCGLLASERPYYTGTSYCRPCLGNRPNFTRGKGTSFRNMRPYSPASRFTWARKSCMTQLNSGTWRVQCLQHVINQARTHPGSQSRPRRNQSLDRCKLYFSTSRALNL
jgi:hypothetical protein